jgi:pimeloyl-ACP methyl ester carboxylesterase
MWEPHILSLEHRFRCIAYTQRHHGTAAWRDGGPPYGVATHAADLNGLMDALGLKAVTVVAWSYAGHVALHAAGRRPDQVSRCILFEPGVRSLIPGEEDAPAVAADAQALFGPIFEAVGRGDLTGAARALIDGSGGAGCFDALGGERRSLYLDNARTLPKLLAQEEPPPASREDLSALPMPVHVAWGEASRPASRLPARAVARCFPDRSRHAIPGAGHLWPEEQPDAFCRLVAELA